MKFAIVGVGVSGLAAARTLSSAGHEVSMFEKQGHVGGRVTSERHGDFLFDSGASSVAPRGRALEKALSELNTPALMRIDKPIYIHKALRVEAGDPLRMKIERFTFLGGNQVLPSLLAEGLNVQLNQPIEMFELKDGRPVVLDEVFDGLILATPAPVTTQILKNSGDGRSLAHVQYRACLSVMLGFDVALDDRPYHALIEPEQRHPLTWVSIESQKAPDRAPEGKTAFVAQMSPMYSKQRFVSPDQVVVRDTIDYLDRLYQRKWPEPEVASVHRWEFSQPESVAMFDSLNPIGSPVLIAGDALLGGRVEYAYEVGVMAANRMLTGVVKA